jgi:hypothetical protein
MEKIGARWKMILRYVCMAPDIFFKLKITSIQNWSSVTMLACLAFVHIITVSILEYYQILIHFY